MFLLTRPNFLWISRCFWHVELQIIPHFLCSKNTGWVRNSYVITHLQQTELLELIWVPWILSTQPFFKCILSFGGYCRAKQPDIIWLDGCVETPLVMTQAISHQVHRLSQSPVMSICKNILSQTYWPCYLFRIFNQTGRAHGRLPGCLARTTWLNVKVEFDHNSCDCRMSTVQQSVSLAVFVCHSSPV